jgi:hypothetical protein
MKNDNLISWVFSVLITIPLLFIDYSDGLKKPDLVAFGIWAFGIFVIWKFNNIWKKMD